ncbi:MAG: hypothetical protein ACI4XR_02765 [Bacilli bacterium]
MEENEKALKNKNRKKQRKYRLLILLLLLFGTGIMLATSTYAWFTSNKNVSVETLSVNIAAQNGIQISVDGTNWKAIVQKADLQNAINTYTAAKNQLPSVLEPVSTGGVASAGVLPMYYGTIDSNTSGNYILTTNLETDANGTTGKYIAYDLFFKVNSDTRIAITSASGVKSSDGNDTGIKNASRIAFVKLGNVPDGTALSTIQGLNSGTDVYIWEPNYDSHTSTGIANARDVYGLTVADGDTTVVPYSGVIAAITTDDNILLGNATEANDATKFKTVTPTYKTVFGYSDNFEIFSLTAGITKVRIYMWVEGQDVDCENNASSGNIDYDLYITTVEEGS